MTKINLINYKAIWLFNNNEIFRRVANDLHASVHHYKVTQTFVQPWYQTESYCSETRTISVFYASSEKGTIFEETFHAGQHEFYGTKKRTSLQKEVEAKVSLILSGLDSDDPTLDVLTTKDYDIIKTYFSNVKEGKKYNNNIKEFNATTNKLAENILKKYRRAGFMRSAENDLNNFKTEGTIDYLEDIIKKSEKNKGLLDIKKFAGFKN